MASESMYRRVRNSGRSDPAKPVDDSHGERWGVRTLVDAHRAAVWVETATESAIDRCQLSR